MSQSSFWGLSDGKKPEKTTSFETGGFDLIPDNTTALAIIDEAGWRAGGEYGPDYISVRWTILAPAEFKNRKIFQKIKVNDEKPGTADNAKRMLMAMDTIAGGKLATIDREPEDEELIAALVNRQMVIKLKVWTLYKQEFKNGKKVDTDEIEKQGNYVAAVSEKKGSAPAKKTAPKPEPVAEGVDPGYDADVEDGDIPF